MPRKYRPPVAKRRKSRNPSIPYGPETAEEEPASTPDADGDAPLLAVDVAQPVPEPEDRPLRALRREGERHVIRDYGHVRGELLRIAAIATFIIVALIITALLRN